MSDYFNKHAKEWDQNQYRIERAKWVAHALKAAIPLAADAKVLDFGCGTGLLGLNFTDCTGEVWLGDNSEGMLAVVREKLAAQNISNAFAVNLNEEEQMPGFDAIISLMVLHHIDDVRAQLKKISGWLVSGGYIGLCDLDTEDGSFHQEAQVPHHGFERAFIKSCLEENQIRVFSETTVHVDKRVVDGKEKEYPVFMIVGKKSV